ncbi:rhodanese-like domain-containing protein [Pseudonocardia nematodicida]|uniref:Rhodanese-like domain-containing protein n=1 Tax=Pseudonocardia nematodicida TaxID=1206997 RepID=A0ABV1K7S2_9PSEU
MRGDAAWAHGRLPGALHMPAATIRSRAATEIDPDARVVVHCWGPGCNGATKAALALAELGYDVREMIGGFEYWVREGLPVDTAGGRVARTPDDLTVVPAAAGCEC